MVLQGQAVLLLLLLLQLLLFFCQKLSSAASPSMVRPGCPEKCGDVPIPYPFGFQPGCYKEERYNITCKLDQNPHQPSSNNRDILEIAVSEGEMRVKNWVAYACYNDTGQVASNQSSWMRLGRPDSLFTFSDKSAFFAIGCNTIGLLQGSMGLEFTTGCVSFCRSTDQVRNNSCSGAGCCQTQIPKGTKKFDFFLSTFNQSKVTNSCSYAFLGERDKFQFKTEDLEEPSPSFTDRIIRTVPIVIDWAIGDEKCEEAKGNLSTYACGPNSDCSNKMNREGYFCRCRQGYEGNPYLPEGCQDIDECANPKACQGQEICKNTPGSFACSCPDGMNKDGSGGCIKETEEFPLVQVVLGAGLGILFLLVGSFVLFLGLKRRRLMMLKEKFFKQNGGLLLQQQIAAVEGGTESTKIFTIEELKSATKNFDDSRILGKGGCGTVYKGILSNKRVVAIKKSKIIDQNQIEQFINELAILSYINHRNVVRLLGCCLETEVPLLVYEYVSNGTLFYHIHGEGRPNSLSWRSRLRIAAETAGALAYLHSAASIPIFHRDVKSTNILLDENYTAKVSDFGASRFIPIDKAQVTTLVQGTMGYLDPEYFHTSQLTDKSDVYSFGVVLAELLTGMLPLSFERPQNERNLSTYFIESIKENRLLEILEPSIVAEGTMEQLTAVALLAKRCLKVKGDERPTMMVVAAELEGLRRNEAHPWVGLYNEESDRLLSESTRDYSSDAKGYYRFHNERMSNDLEMTRYSSLHDQKMMHMDLPR